jgi:hypothetical protein
MKSKIIVGALSVSLLSAVAFSPVTAFAQSIEGDSLCEREARTFEEWVAQIFLCR